MGTPAPDSAPSPTEALIQDQETPTLQGRFRRLNPPSTLNPTMRRQSLIALPHPRLVCLEAWKPHYYIVHQLPTALRPISQSTPLLTLLRSVPHTLAWGQVLKTHTYLHRSRPTVFQLHHLLSPSEVQTIANTLAGTQVDPSLLTPTLLGPTLHELASRIHPSSRSQLSPKSVKWGPRAPIPDKIHEWMRRIVNEMVEREVQRRLKRINELSVPLDLVGSVA